MIVNSKKDKSNFRPKISYQENRFKTLSNLFSYLDRKPKNIPGQGNNYAIIFYDGDYLKGKGKMLCLGIYKTLYAAHFIAMKVEQKESLAFLPKVKKVTGGLMPQTSWKVDGHLNNLRNELKDLEVKYADNAE